MASKIILYNVNNTRIVLWNLNALSATPPVLKCLISVSNITATFHFIINFDDIKYTEKNKSREK